MCFFEMFVWCITWINAGTCEYRMNHLKPLNDYEMAWVSSCWVRHILPASQDKYKQGKKTRDGMSMWACLYFQMMGAYQRQRPLPSRLHVKARGTLDNCSNPPWESFAGWGILNFVALMLSGWVMSIVAADLGTVSEDTKEFRRIHHETTRRFYYRKPQAQKPCSTPLPHHKSQTILPLLG